MGYANPLLTEILAETHFEPATFLPDQFFDVVPLLKQSGFPTVEISEIISIKQNENTLAPEAAPRIRCWNEDKTRLVQLSPDLLVVNLVGRYPGWDAFQDLFSTTHDALSKALGLVAPESVSLTTIDQFDVPREGYTLGRYIVCDGAWIPRWYADSAEAIDITMGRGVVQEDGRNRQLHLRVRIKDDRVEGVFRTAIHDKVGSRGTLNHHLSELHDQLLAVFEALVTDETRATLMGGRTS